MGKKLQLKNNTSNKDLPNRAFEFTKIKRKISLPQSELFKDIVAIDLDGNEHDEDHIFKITPLMRTV